MNRLIVLAAAIALIAAVGCGSGSQEEPGYAKKDFSKSPPPPEYKGPGQPGGPGSGPSDAATPPANIAGGG